MAKERRWLLGLTIAGALAATVPGGVAAGAGSKSFRFSAQVSANLLPITDGYQVDGVFAGAGGPTPIVLTEVTNGNSTSGTWVAYFATGGLHGLDHGTSTFSNGVSTIADRLTVTGGTGRFNGARGTLNATGAIQVPTGVTDLHMGGTLRLAAGGRLPAPAAHPRTHRYSAVGRTEVAARHGNIEILAGPVTGLTPGGGAFVIQVPIGIPTATAHLAYFDGSGVISGVATIMRHRQPDGSTSITGSGGFHTGTGRYRHLRIRPGNTFSGMRDPSNGLITINLSGALVY